MHGEEWDGMEDLKGWWMSEKMDGIRAHWNGEKLLSRQSKEFFCPNWFTEGFPKGIKLDGEMWLGRGMFESLISIVRSSNAPDSSWKTIKYVIFDLPGSSKGYELRIAELKSLHLPPHAIVIDIERCDGNEHML